MIKKTHAIKKIMLPIRPRIFPSFTLEAIKKPAHIIKRIQPQRWNVISRFFSSTFIKLDAPNVAPISVPLDSGSAIRFIFAPIGHVVYHRGSPHADLLRCREVLGHPFWGSLRWLRRGTDKRKPRTRCNAPRSQKPFPRRLL